MNLTHDTGDMQQHSRVIPLDTSTYYMYYLLHDIFKLKSLAPLRSTRPITQVHACMHVYTKGGCQ